MQHWADAERELWQSWFNIVRNINFRPEPGAGAQAGRDLVQLWQDSAHKMIDAQAALDRRYHQDKEAGVVMKEVNFGDRFTGFDSYRN